MGWFTNDEVVIGNTSSHDIVQSVSIALLAVAALAYGLFRLCNAHHRHQAEQVAERVARVNRV